MSNQNEHTFTVGSTIRRVFADVDSDTFHLFSKRCRNEGVPLADGLAELVRQYAHGAVLTNVTKKTKNTGADYLSDHGRPHP